MSTDLDDRRPHPVPISNFVHVALEIEIKEFKDKKQLGFGVADIQKAVIGNEALTRLSLSERCADRQTSWNEWKRENVNGKGMDGWMDGVDERGHTVQCSRHSFLSIG
jgi:hypothetical protein